MCSTAPCSYRYLHVATAVATPTCVVRLHQLRVVLGAGTGGQRSAAGCDPRRHAAISRPTPPDLAGVSRVGLVSAHTPEICRSAIVARVCSMATTVTRSRAKYHADVNVHNPPEYWDYESLNVHWGCGSAPSHAFTVCWTALQTPSFPPPKSPDMTRAQGPG